jgi:glucose-6-phosphate 1-epimerase
MAAAGWKGGRRNGLDVVELTTPASTCTIALHGAQVLSFAPRGERDWLWVSDRASMQIGKALRGGIPICFPWFGPHPTQRELPAHGFARTRLWRPVGGGPVPADDGVRVRVELALESDAETMRLFPHPFVARLAVTAGAGLEVALTVVNPGAAPLAFEVALHSYFAVADAAAVEVRGLGGRAYVDKAAGGVRRAQGAEPVRFDGEIDRVYDGGGPVIIADPADPRPLQVETRGAGSTVVWNPGAAKAAALADVAPEAFHGFVCVETGNVGDRRVEVPPGGRHETAVRYTRM